MRTHVLAILALLTINFAVKYSLWSQPPQTFTDSLSYLAPAISLLDGRGYGSQEAGYRTPIYPLFLAAIISPFDHHDLSTCREPRVPACLGDIQTEPSADANLRTITRVQIVLGFATIALIYFFAWRVANNFWVAALCALTYPLDLSTGYWEISILTESLAIFLLALTVALTLVAANSTQHRLLAHTALGVSLAALALCQPIYLGYAGIVAPFLLIARPKSVIPSEARNLVIRLSIKTLRLAQGDIWCITVVLLIPILAILTWCTRNYYTDGFFTPSSLSGYNLTQMVGPFMELAPEHYRDLAEIYVDTRNERLPIRGTHSGTIFFAYREMLDARKTTWAGLSRDLQDLSLQLILKNPLGYLQVTGESFAQFWKYGLGRQNPGLPASYGWVSWFFDSRVQQTLVFLFWLTPLGLLLARGTNTCTALRLVQCRCRETTWVWFAMATVWYVALFSSALNFGDNERYRVPVAWMEYSSIVLTIQFLFERLNVRTWKR